jgi:hypothetical protein
MNTWRGWARLNQMGNKHPGELKTYGSGNLRYGSGGKPYRALVSFQHVTRGTEHPFHPLGRIGVGRRHRLFDESARGQLT